MCVTAVCEHTGAAGQRTQLPLRAPSAASTVLPSINHRYRGDIRVYTVHTRDGLQRDELTKLPGFHPKNNKLSIITLS